MNKNKSCSNPDPTDTGIVVPIRNSQAILHAGPMLGKLLGGLLGAVLQLAHGRGVAALLGRLAVGLDALLAVGRQLGLPVALSGFCLLDGVLLVALVVVWVGVVF